MNFDEFKYQLSKLESETLNGKTSHNKIMDLKIRKNIFKEANYGVEPKESAVLCLIYPGKNNLAHIVFILRKNYKGHHAGQIAFPGGKTEPEDLSAEYTAIREAKEEVGIDPDQVKIIRKLSPIFIPISNYKVQAFLAYTDRQPVFKKQVSEVEEIIEAPLLDFLNLPLVPIRKKYFDKTYNLYAFQTGNLLIWGATAMILSEIVDLIKKTQ